ncbi:MAG: hypothetical protein LRY39_00950 [Alphaproteobacteria bacterium]|nr:hypothetical protein [Alphaproteobacteria bacterium]
MGSNCADEGRTNNTGYNGETTALAYTVSKDGRNGMVCVSHGAAGPLVSMFAVTAPPQQRPATSSQQQDKETVIKTLTGNDIKVMRQKGFELEGYSANDSSTLAVAAITTAQQTARDITAGTLQFPIKSTTVQESRGKSVSSITSPVNRVLPHGRNSQKACARVINNAFI